MFPLKSLFVYPKFWPIPRAFWSLWIRFIHTFLYVADGIAASWLGGAIFWTAWVHSAHFSFTQSVFLVTSFGGIVGIGGLRALLFRRGRGHRSSKRVTPRTENRRDKRV